MDYVCTEARFRFFDGYNTYDVMFQFGIMRWYIFEEGNTNNALWHSGPINPAKSKSPTRSSAEDILSEYLTGIK